MFDVSVITCTHNPRRDYLEAVLRGLRQQGLSTGRWEYLLIDNASNPPCYRRFDLSWHPHARSLREEKLGLTAARLRGILESNGSLLIFVDDDNVVDTDYLEKALETAEAKPFLGAWSGQCRPQFDEPPPEWTRRYWGNLVIREFDRDVWSNLPRLPETMPCGAGLCVRRHVAQRYLEAQGRKRGRLQLDRTGDSLVSGGDNDLAGCACDVGLGVGLITSLRLTHLMSAQRVTVGYLARLAEGIEFSSKLLDAERGIAEPRRKLSRRVLDELRILRLKGPHREIARAVQRGRIRALAELARSDERFRP